MLVACHLEENGLTLRGFWDGNGNEQRGEVSLDPPSGDRADWLWQVGRAQERLTLDALLDRLPEEWRQWAVERSGEAFAEALREGRERLQTLTTAKPAGLTQALRRLEAAERLARQLHRVRVSWDLKPS